MIELVGAIGALIIIIICCWIEMIILARLLDWAIGNRHG